MLVWKKKPPRIEQGYDNIPSTEQEQEPIIKFDYSCYKCIKDNHGTPVYETNSKSDYERHVINNHPKTLCYPNKADLELHGWEPQGKDWEK